MESALTSIRYQSSKISPGALSEAVDAIFVEMASDTDVLPDLGLIGLSPESVRTLGDQIEVRPEEDGVIGEMIVIAVFFKPTINHIAETLWDMVLDRLRRRFGDDVLGPESGRD